MMLTGSVTEAANLMAVTQPAVSRLLRDLQELLRLQLFEKRGTGLVPTAAAMALFTEVERSFVGLERITAAAEEISRPAHRQPADRGPAGVVNGFLPRFAGHFLMDRPNLNLSLFGVISPIVVDWGAERPARCRVRRGADRPCRAQRRPHAGRRPGRGGPGGPSAGRQGLYRRRATWRARRSSRSAPAVRAADQVDQVFAQQDVRRVLRVETSLSEIMCGMVSSGLGVAIADPFTATEFAGRGVVARRFEPRIDFDFAAVYPPQRSPSAVAIDFVEALARAIIIRWSNRQRPARIRVRSRTGARGPAGRRDRQPPAPAAGTASRPVSAAFGDRPSARRRRAPRRSPGRPGPGPAPVRPPECWRHRPRPCRADASGGR